MNYKYFILTFLFHSFLFSQESISFKPHKQFYVYGDAMVIGNNIVSEDEEEAFTDLMAINDLIDMKYVDIDNDKSTFSSSQASLKLPNENPKIVSALLYWSAIYSYDKGVKKRRGNEINYKGNKTRNKAINKIKFKTPKGNYQTIEGDVIFDGYGKDKFKDSAPYVCFADVTDILNNNNTKNGSYTVANIKATQGFISGGSAGGWLLYVVYETNTTNPKYITTYNGLVHVDNKPLDVKLTDFQTVENGPVKASITIAALEGDSKLKKDECLVLNVKDNIYLPLHNTVRSKKNFFNSKISINDNLFEDRIPNSTNTLGFDLAQLEIPNNDNAIISNNATSIALRFKTRADRFQLFFAAFKTEINPAYYNIKREEIELKKIESLKEIVQVTATKPIDTNNNKDLINSKLKETISNQQGVLALKEKESQKVIEYNIKLKEENIRLREHNVKLRENSVNVKEKNIKLREINVNLKEDVYKLKEENIKLKEENIKLREENIRLREENIRLRENKQLNKTIETEKPLTVTSNTEKPSNTLKSMSKKDIKKLNKIKDKKSLIIPNLKPGYYITTNEFSKDYSAKRWSESLQADNFKTKIFQHPNTKWYSVSVYNSEDIYEVYQEMKRLKKLSVFYSIWVYKINL